MAEKYYELPMFLVSKEITEPAFYIVSFSAVRIIQFNLQVAMKRQITHLSLLVRIVFEHIIENICTRKVIYFALRDKDKNGSSEKLRCFHQRFNF